MSPREEFAKVLTALRAHDADELRKVLAPIEREYELKLWRWWRQAHPKKAFSRERAEKAYGVNLPLLQAEFRLRGEPLVRAHRDRRAELEAELKRLAPLVPLDPNPKKPTRYLSRVASEYHTQGGGADTYARVWCELTVFVLNSVGIKAGASRSCRAFDRDAGGEWPWEVWVDLDEIQVEAARRLEHKVPQAELVRFCWKHGANPRVYWPLLPAGFEEANGLDFFGGFSTDRAENVHVNKTGGGS